MKVHFSRVLKTLLSLGFFLVLIVIVFDLVSRSGSKVKIEEGADSSITERPESREEIKYLEVIKGVKKNFNFTAGRHYLGKDGLYHLEGNVHAVLTKRGKGKEIILTGDELIHDKSRSFFRLKGKAKIESGDLIASSSSIEYSQEKGVFSINNGVVFKSERMEGMSRRMEYSDLLQKIRLTGNVKLHLNINLDNDLPLIILTDMLEFRKIGKHGNAVGHVRLIQGKSAVSAEKASFSLTKDGDYIKEMILKGKVVAILSQDEQKDQSDSPENSKPSFSFYQNKREIRTEELVVKGFRDLSQMRVFQSKQDCTIMLTSSKGEETEIQAGAIDISFLRDGYLRDFRASQKARIIEKDNKGEILRLLEGNEIIIEGNRDVLKLKGGDGQIPRFVHQGSDITAGTISFNMKTGGFDASDDLKGTLALVGQGKKDPGLFSSDTPLFITASQLRYLPKTKRFQFKEKIKIWQTETVLQAEEIFLQEETGEIRCSGEVDLVMMYQADENSPKRKVSISAEKMFYDPTKKKMSFEENGSIKFGEVLVEAERVFVSLDIKKGGLLNILARDNVLLKQGQREGQAKEALYDLKNDVIIFSGNPRINDPLKGRIQGDKLTFHVADDKIIVENKGQERSLAVIK